ncbi:MAG: DNA translocase FtsK 4TM domain-containing protein [Deltaproteobacteria bacterium]|nr:DNA translocase FtsK 4TM domain-containing protein [Deltaproteobacteria bacterium]
MAKPTTESGAAPSFLIYLRKELSALAWLALSTFLFLILLTYSAADPSFNNNLHPDRIANAGGLIGSHLADLLYQAFGLIGFLFPGAALVIGGKLLRLRDLEVRFHKIVALGALIFSLCGLLSLRFQAVRIGHLALPEAGGAFGHLLSSLLSRYLNHSGALLVLGVTFVASFLVSFRFSLLWFLKKCRERWQLYRQHRRERREEREQERERQRREEQKKAPLPEAQPEPAAVAEAPRIVAEPKPEPPPPPKKKKAAPEPLPEMLELPETPGVYQAPTLALLEHEEPNTPPQSRESLMENARLLERKLLDFGVEGKVVEVKPGPVVTMYEFLPAPGIKVNKIAGLQDDLTMALRALSIRIVAPIPGRGVVGIEIPNQIRETVFLKEILEAGEFQHSDGKLPMALGKDIFGHTVVADLAQMPHLLVAGATGSGKSVSINTMILSLLYQAAPEDVRFIMVDPKRLELSIYEGIPHLLLPVVTDPKKAGLALSWALREMERRYRLLSDKQVRNIEGYNKKIAAEPAPPEPEEEEITFPEVDENGQLLLPARAQEKLEHGHLPYIVIMVDELADLMMVAGREIEESITRLAQMARAAGIHLILATQRPSVDVITGLIKANFPTRMSFKVVSRTDSRTILDIMGAEALLGNGDMLYRPPGSSILKRIHGAYVSEREVERVVAFLKRQGEPEYDESILDAYENSDGDEPGTDAEYDERWDEALALVARSRQASISMLQRHLRVGYNRAARMIERMEKEGIIGPSDGTSKPREVFIQPIES